MFCLWVLAGAMAIGFGSSVGLVAAVYADYRRLAWTSALLLVAAAMVTTGCSWGLYTV
jgi:hypothetical protein